MTAITACDVLEASTPEVDDVVRLEDRYGRVNTNGVGRSSASRGATTSKRRTGARRERRS
jgi:hypothetical protein